MHNLWRFLSEYWISLCVLAGVALAVRYVYKNKDKLLLGPDDRK